jgi:hypothetical protein
VDANRTTARTTSWRVRAAATVTAALLSTAATVTGLEATARPAGNPDPYADAAGAWDPNSTTVVQAVAWYPNSAMVVQAGAWDPNVVSPDGAWDPNAVV